MIYNYPVSYKNFHVYTLVPTDYPANNRKHTRSVYRHYRCLHIYAITSINYPTNDM